jgi:hypothetical protein
MHRLAPVIAVVVSLVWPPHAVHAEDITTPNGCRFAYAHAVFDTTKKEFNHLRIYLWDFLPDGSVIESHEQPFGPTIRNQVGRWSMIGDQMLVVSHQTGVVMFASKISMYMRQTSSSNQIYIRDGLRYIGPVN